MNQLAELLVFLWQEILFVIRFGLCAAYGDHGLPPVSGIGKGLYQIPMTECVTISPHCHEVRCLLVEIGSTVIIRVKLVRAVIA